MHERPARHEQIGWRMGEVTDTFARGYCYRHEGFQQKGAPSPSPVRWAEHVP